MTRHPDRPPQRPGRQPAWLPGEDGMAAATTMMVMAMSMITFVVCVNVIVVLYGRGVVRGALDEGARVGARSGGQVADCERRVAQVLDELLGGPIGDGVSYRCAVEGDQVVATADVLIRGWLPGMPDARFQLAARSVREPGGP